LTATWLGKISVEFLPGLSLVVTQIRLMWRSAHLAEASCCLDRMSTPTHVAILAGRFTLVDEAFVGLIQYCSLVASVDGHFSSFLVGF